MGQTVIGPIKCKNWGLPLQLKKISLKNSCRMEVYGYCNIEFWRKTYFDIFLKLTKENFELNFHKGRKSEI